MGARVLGRVRHVVRDAGVAREERPVAPAPAMQHRGGLRREDVRVRPQAPWQRAVDVLVVDGVRARGAASRASAGGPDVALRADVVEPIDRQLERVLLLAGARVEVAPREDRLDVVAEVAEVRADRGELVDALRLLEQRVVRERRRLLEEAVGVVPRRERRVGGEPEPAPDVGVHRGALRRPGGREALVEAIHEVEEPALVDLLGAQRERVVVAGAERARRLVAQAGELAQRRIDVRALTPRAAVQTASRSATSVPVSSTASTSLSVSSRPSTTARCPL